MGSWILDVKEKGEQDRSKKRIGLRNKKRHEKY